VPVIRLQDPPTRGDATVNLMTLSPTYIRVIRSLQGGDYDEKMRVLVTFVLLTAIIWSGCSSQPVTSGPAPDFTLADLNGSTVTLSGLKGQIVVLDFWATWCGPCVEALVHLQELHEGYAGRGVIILAINVEAGRDR
jgi:thiol-disulfide isomerase/thioredoxin